MERGYFFGGTAVLPCTVPFALTLATPAPVPRSLPPAAATARYDDAAQCHVLLDPDSRLAGELIPLVTYLRRQHHPHDQYGS